MSKPTFYTTVLAIVAMGSSTVIPLTGSLAQELPSAAQITDALKPKTSDSPTTRKLLITPRANPDSAVIDSLRHRQTRQITVEERAKVAEIARTRPSIDLEVTFEYDSDLIGSRAVPTLVNLGTALQSADLKGSVFVVAGHTDAQGGDGYNQSLSERRADAVKRFLVEKFEVPPENLISIGFGETHLKNNWHPYSGENRRVQIVNTEVR
jgi:outer membrane protein OmpA-like peptidoglycan-associated protein